MNGWYKMSNKQLVRDEQEFANKTYYYTGLINSSYKDALKIIKSHHDIIMEPYFINNVKNNKIMKYKDLGLMVHHDLENEIAGLSSIESLIFGIKYQQPDVLTYTNVYEHFILHLLIQIEKEQYKPSCADTILIRNILDIVNYKHDGILINHSTYSQGIYTKICSDNRIVLNTLIGFYKKTTNKALNDYLEPFIKLLYLVEQKISVPVRKNSVTLPTKVTMSGISEHIETIIDIITEKQNQIALHTNKNTLAIIDTETGDEFLKNDTLVSIGIVIVDCDLNILDSYYSNVENNAKFIMYGDMLNIDDIPPKSLSTVRDETCALLDKYNVKTLLAYNASFDRRVLTNAKFPIITNWSDMMKVARNKKYNTNIPNDIVAYKTGAIKKGYGVDDMLSYITNISESHNALTDVYDELLILIDLCKSNPLQNVLKFGKLKKINT